MNDIAAVTSAPQFTQLATDDTTPSFTHSAGIPASPIASVTAGRVSIGRDADAVLEGRSQSVEEVVAASRDEFVEVEDEGAEK